MTSPNWIRPWLIIGALLASTSAFAQWQWVESDGRKVYSDRPPPPSVPLNRILKQPGGAPLQQPSTPRYENEATQAAARAARASAASAAAQAQAAEAKAEADMKKSADSDALEAKAKEAEAAEAAKRKAEADRIAAARAENCRRAKEAKATLDSGIRMAKVNDKGERIVLDDKARAEETQRVNRLIASECGPLPKS